MIIADDMIIFTHVCIKKQTVFNFFEYTKIWQSFSYSNRSLIWIVTIAHLDVTWHIIRKQPHRQNLSHLIFVSYNMKQQIFKNISVYIIHDSYNI